MSFNITFDYCIFITFVSNAVISFLAVFDDIEGDAAHNKIMVGSMNAASKFTKTDGEEEQLGGTIFTKNLKKGMKMPQKIIEGRNNWLLMERDPDYEEEDMGDNIERNFEHCNQMSNVQMPRDFLAKLTQYFIRSEGQDLSFFQEAQREASEIMSRRRPHWGKRKAKSASLFLSIFFLVEKEVSESSDALCKELFVEIFSSKDDYIDLVMKAMDRIDEVEASMLEGKTISIPNWTYGEGDGEEEVDELPTTASRNDSDIDSLVMDCLNLVSEFGEVDRSKYVKVFEKDSLILGIQHNKVKTLAKQTGKKLPNFQAQSKNYPSFVSLKTEAFTKLTATVSRGASNTLSGFCTSIMISKLKLDTKKRIQELFEIDDDALLIEETDDDDADPLASQDYPMFTQSQSLDTLKVCELCNFKTRSKRDLQEHMSEHPSCSICKIAFKTEENLIEHAPTHHTVPCTVCNVSVLESKLKAHMDHHKLSDHYRKGLTKSKAKKKKPTNESEEPPAPRLNSYLVFCRTFREEKKREFPQLNMLGINAILREEWSKLTIQEKAAYKPPATSTPSAPAPTASTSTESSDTGPVVVAPAASTSADSSDPGPVVAAPPRSTVNYTQSQISVCNICGRMFFDSATLNEHKQFVHAISITTEEVRPAETEPPAVDLLEQDQAVDLLEQEQAGPGQQPAGGEPAHERKFWVKMKRVLWPCKLIEEGKVMVFNDAETVLEVDSDKLDEFKPMNRIPRSKTAEWRRGYQKALDN